MLFPRIVPKKNVPLSEEFEIFQYNICLFPLYVRTGKKKRINNLTLSAGVSAAFVLFLCIVRKKNVPWEEF